MKVVTKLGVATEAELRHPTTCFLLSKAVTRLSNALAFGEYYLNQSRGKLKARDFEHMSTSIFSSKTGAENLSVLVEDKILKEDLKRYIREAKRVNEDLKKAMDGKVLTINLSNIKESTKKLRSRIAKIEKKVENLCTVEKPITPLAPVSIKTLQGRLGSPIRKRPIYPRYFVASMGRSLRR